MSNEFEKDQELARVMNPNDLINAEFEWMVSCNKDRCILFADCFKDNEFRTKACPMGHAELGGMFSDKYSVEEKRVHWNMMRDKKTRGTFDEEFKVV